nr:uncharacterized protein LOC108950950 [Ciona intestinalis]|eukprot:XP_018672793.1 uncharacterized protein LOC108950950 [Ciona intestinalis]
MSSASTSKAPNFANRTFEEQDLQFVIIGILLCLTVIFSIVVVLYYLKRRPRYPFLTKHAMRAEKNYYAAISVPRERGIDSAGREAPETPQEEIYATVDSLRSTPTNTPLTQYGQATVNTGQRSISVATIDATMTSYLITSSNFSSPIQQLSLPSLPSLNDTTSSSETEYANLGVSLTNSMKDISVSKSPNLKRVSRSLQTSPTVGRDRSNNFKPVSKSLKDIRFG